MGKYIRIQRVSHGCIIPIGGGGHLIFSYKRRLGPILGFKILICITFGGLQKNKYFGGYEDFVHMFGESSQNWTRLVL